jgi:hypothetical protein
MHVLNERGRAYTIAKTGNAFDGENLIIIVILVAILMISNLLGSI